MYSNSTETVRITRRCPLCGRQHEQTFNKADLDHGLELYQRGVLLQRAFPTFTATQREFLKTGICSTCWDAI